MLTITIDDELVSQARKLGKHKNDDKESGHEIVAQLVTADQVLQQTNFALQILVIR